MRLSYTRNSLRKTAFWSACGAAAAFAILEVTLQLLPVSTSSATGYFVDPMLLTYPPQHKFSVATGWNLANAQTHRANNYGFVAARQFERDPKAIAVIGDSFVEASMLSTDEQLATQLEHSLKTPAPVYSLGSPGSSMLDYAERIRFAATEFGIRRFVVVLENGDIGQALCGSGNIHAACLDPTTLAKTIERQPEPSALKRTMRHLALPQYLFSQLKASMDVLRPENLRQRIFGTRTKPVEVAAPANSQHQDPRMVAGTRSQAVVADFFARIEPYAIDKLVFVWIQPNDVEGSPLALTRKTLSDAADAHKAIALEVGPLIADHEKQTGLSMHVSPQDGHLNKLALQLVAKQIAPTLAN
jgi:hypothetical protein